MQSFEDVKALGDLAVAEILKTEVISVSPDTSILNIIRIFRDYNFEGIPVVKNGYLKGMAMRRELLNLYFIQTRDLDESDTKKLFQLISLMDTKQPVSTFMDAEPLTVSPRFKVGKLAKIMLENDQFSFPVVKTSKSKSFKEKKKFIGIVTLTDMMPLLYEAMCC